MPPTQLSRRSRLSELVVNKAGFVVLEPRRSVGSELGPAMAVVTVKGSNSEIGSRGFA